jgi:hypothetical protein
MRFIATSSGLRELEDISKSDTFLDRVQELWMIPIVFEGFYEMDKDEFAHSSYAVSTKGSKPANDDDDDKLTPRYAAYQAIVADHLDVLGSATFVDRLRRCFACFRNLETIGLSHHPTSFLLNSGQHTVRFLGWRDLKNQFDVRSSFPPLSYVRRSRTVRSSTWPLSYLLQALNGSSRKVRKLHTCCPDECGAVSSNLMLTKAQYNSFLVILEELEDLHLCIWSEGLKRSYNSASQTWIGLMIKFAPSLRRLAFSFTYGQNTLFQRFSQNIVFTRLRDLHLDSIYTTFDALKTFLTTAKPTLTTFTLCRVRIPVEELSSTSSIEIQGVLLWQRVWDFFRDELSSLQRFSMRKVEYSGTHIILIQEPGGLQPTTHAAYDGTMTKSSFSEWINQLTPVSSSDRCLWMQIDNGKYPICSLALWIIC